MARTMQFLLMVSIVLVLACSAVASAEENTPTMENATELFQNGDYKAAAAAFKQIVKREPENVTAWANLGFSYYNMKEYEKAISAYTKVENRSSLKQNAAYNIACSYSLMGKKEEALDALERSIGYGFSNVKLLSTDTDLAIIRDDERFSRFIELAGKNLSPCEYNSKCRELDFWIGEWQVINVAGATLGTDRIEKGQNGCLLRESYTSITNDFTGTSIVFYDPAAESWKQIWIDTGGGIVYYDGHFENGTVHFEGKSIVKDGKIELSRMLLEPNDDGSVRQLIEKSADNGKTWYVWFDGKYVKK